ncbi:MAG: hypothetical protein Q7R96_05320 [Nanoarchaeota archaeon]|nr:hypothetical protein [Nanoarchaeota archaeon]
MWPFSKKEEREVPTLPSLQQQLHPLETGIPQTPLQPLPTFNPLQEPSHQDLGKDFALINSKLDLINARLENIHQRLANVERIAQAETKRQW